MLSEIGRKLVLTKSWRWFPGMLTLGGARVKSVTDDGKAFLDRGFVTLDAANNWSVAYPTLDWDDFPNAGDPATRGAMMEVLHRASGLTPALFFRPASESWVLELHEKSGKSLVWEGQALEEVFLSAFEGLESELGLTLKDEIKNI